MSTVVKDLGAATAYGYAVEKGYTGTEAEFAELMASYATVGQTAVTAAQTATTKASEAATSATTATNKASEATTAATTATNKAVEAQADADAAALDASQALSAASTATTKASEATTAAATAVSAKDDAVSANTAAQSAKTAAQTAQTGAETAAASVQSSAAQIATNTSDISELKEDLNTQATTNVDLAVGAWDDSTTNPHTVILSGYTRSKSVIRYVPFAHFTLSKTGTGAQSFIYYDANLTKQGVVRSYAGIPNTAAYFVFYTGPGITINSVTYVGYLPYDPYKSNIDALFTASAYNDLRYNTDDVGLVQNSAWDDSTILPTIVVATNYKRCANLIVYSADAEFTIDASGTINYIYYDANNEKLGTATKYSQIPNSAHSFVFYAAPSVTITKASYQYFVRKSQQADNYLSNVAVGNDYVPVTNKTAQIPVASSQHGGYMSASDKIKLDGIVSPGTITISGSGVSKNAAAFGFLPTNDGASNATALQNALNGGGTILVDLVGTYKLSRTIRVPSNCTIIFGAGTYVERCTEDGKYPRYLFINDGVFSGDYNENITIKNLTVVNGAISGNPDIVYPIVGLRGIVTMARINNFMIDGFTLVDHTFNNYAIQATFFNKATFKNVHIETLKDGIHLGIGNGFLIKDCTFLTNDDCIALNAVDYPESNFGVGDIQNGVVEDITMLEAPSDIFARKRGIFLLSGSWSDWESGNTYQLYGDYCVNEGRLYQSYASSPTTQTQVSTDAPTHTSGAQTYSDGFTWLMKQSVDVGYSAVIKNVVFRNIMYERDVENFFTFSSENSAYLRAVYPTAQVVPNENITFENVRSKHGNSTYAFLNASYPFDKLKICMSECIALNRLINFNSDTYVPMTNRTNISLVGNYYDYTGKTIIAEDPNNIPDVYVSICGSMKANGFVYSAYNLTPHVLANDLV